MCAVSGCGQMGGAAPLQVPLCLRDHFGLDDTPHSLCEKHALRTCSGVVCAKAPGGCSIITEMRPSGISQENAIARGHDYHAMLANSVGRADVKICSKCRKFEEHKRDKEELREARTLAREWKCPVEGCEG